MRRNIAILAFALAMSCQLGAVCLEPIPRLVCAEYFRSDVVVEAKLLHTKHVIPEIDQDYFLYEMEPERVLRGKVGPRFEIWEENSSGRAPFVWRLGQSYLLFLSPSEQQDQHENWELDGCGNSRPLKQAAAALNAIDRISKTQSSLIQVAVDGLGGVSGEGRRVKAEGKAGVFTATTDKDGVASLKVPPGTYQVTVPPQGEKKFEPYDLSYDNPRNVLVEKGDCAQIQFVSQQ
jgi:hypothetical protein